MSERRCFVYILVTANNKVMYIGRTEHLGRRMYEHKNALISGFTQKYNVHKLAYYEIFSNAEDAAAREWQLKKWEREWKNVLVSETNPEWKDLYDELAGC